MLLVLRRYGKRKAAAGLTKNRRGPETSGSIRVARSCRFACQRVRLAISSPASLSIKSYYCRDSKPAEDLPSKLGAIPLANCRGGLSSDDSEGNSPVSLSGDAIITAIDRKRRYVAIGLQLSVWQMSKKHMSRRQPFGH